ncbi:SxtJ family membrane protein [Pelagibacteraceae bacterium]|jgi:hypothetical protein|nr:SxtJ family membrane protein [Pelagibacteraceae bacterium]
MKSKSSNRSFGLLFFVLFLFIALWPLTIGQGINKFLLIIALTFLILGLSNSKLLSPLNNAWVKFGEILGIIIAPIVMALVYFIILTPISILIRAFGKDLLKLKFSKKLNSYWTKRQKNLGSMKKQF